MLTRKGLCDSKTYGAGDDAHAVRSALAAEIRKRATFVATIEVEHSRSTRASCAASSTSSSASSRRSSIEQAPAVDKIIADGKRMFVALGQRFANFQSHDRAEEVHASVAAASVIAKVLRDERFSADQRRYEDEFGPITGGGYANAATRRWVRAYVERYGRLPGRSTAVLAVYLRRGSDRQRAAGRTAGRAVRLSYSRQRASAEFFAIRALYAPGSDFAICAARFFTARQSPRTAAASHCFTS